MIEAGVWGLLAASFLVFGAIAGSVLKIPRQLVALAIGFGAGALFSALAFDLTAEAFETGGTASVAIGLAAGAIVFFTGDELLHARAISHRRKRMREGPSESGSAIVLGALLDGIPESVVLGSTLLAGTGVGLPFLAALAVSNFPEAMAAAADLKRERRSNRFIILLWVGVALASGLAAAVGYAVLDGMVSSAAVPFIQAFAAGAILTRLADTMVPEAYADGGEAAGLATVLGFSLAFFLSKVS
jgi:ZIP family zinc transporter